MIKNSKILNIKKLIFYSCCTVLFVACKPTNNTKNIDPAPLLKTVGEDIILPNYIVLETKVSDLHESLLALVEDKTANQLTDAQDKFVEAYLAWQKCSPYQFGPAVDEALNSINIFPTDTLQIRNNMAAGNYDLQVASNIDASGFPALDYILFHNETRILNELDNDSYTDYMLAVSDQIKSKTTAVKTDWESFYLSSFVSNTELSEGSSIGLLTNAMVLNFERNAREAKIGIPAGVRTLNQIVPENVEALYSRNSILLAKEHMQGFKELFDGINGGASYKALLTNLEREQLANNMSEQISIIENSLNSLSDPFHLFLELNNQAALATYSEYQKLLPLLKVEMTSELGILITFSDSDGD